MLPEWAIKMIEDDLPTQRIDLSNRNIRKDLPLLVELISKRKNRLSCLMLDRCNLRNEEAKILSKLTNVDHLSLSQNAISEEGAKILIASPFPSLDLGDNDIWEEIMDFINLGIKQVWLGLYRNKLSKESLEKIKKMEMKNRSKE